MRKKPTKITDAELSMLQAAVGRIAQAEQQLMTMQQAYEVIRLSILDSRKLPAQTAIGQDGTIQPVPEG